MTNADYETTKTVQVEVDGAMHEGRFRVMGGNVIVYFEDEIKYALYGLDRRETVARWLLSDLCRCQNAKKRKRGTSQQD
ncbi:MAG: hypothetical protein AB1704_18965 [Pseudomonadota bacterium]|uniref:hypothetical protein n=1 Tax=Burkholderia sp. 4M9327F10 TaxID=2502223 RepID=UPI002017C739|nr:hypothetical protein [Burkholderia sp. 4M9327F10]